jgi:hypothetical protein
MRQVVATIDGQPHQAGDNYTFSNQTPRPAAVASEMHQDPTYAPQQTALLRTRSAANSGKPPFGIWIVAAVSNAINLRAPR